MVNCCVVPKCHNLSDKQSNIKFHRFPFNRPDILNKWIAAIRRENWNPTKTSKLCSAHFLETDYGMHPRLNRWLLKDDAVPSVFNLSSNLQNKTSTEPARKECSVSISEHENKQPTESSSCTLIDKTKVDIVSTNNDDNTANPSLKILNNVETEHTYVKNPLAMDVDANNHSSVRREEVKKGAVPFTPNEIKLRHKIKKLNQKVRSMEKKILIMKPVITKLQKRAQYQKKYGEILWVNLYE